MRVYRAKGKPVYAEVVEQALRSNKPEMLQLFKVFQDNELASIDQDEGEQAVISIWANMPLMEVAEFCVTNDISIDSFLIDLKFGQLDK